MTAMGRKETSNSFMEMKWSPMLVISVLFHLAIFSVVLFVPEAMPTKRFEGVVYSVNLVEMPAGKDLKVGESRTTTVKKGKSIVKPDTRAKRIQQPKKKKKPLVVAKRTIEAEKTRAKKPEVSPSELIEKAISKIENKAKPEEEAKKNEKGHLETAISKLESEFGSPEGSGLTGGRALSGIPIQIYQMEVEERIKGNWSYPVALRSKKDLEAIVVVVVRRDGIILDTEMKKGSADPVFDESVMRAVRRSDPLPPFPEGYKKSHDEIEINFNLKDLEGY